MKDNAIGISLWYVNNPHGIYDNLIWKQQFSYIFMQS